MAKKPKDGEKRLMTRQGFQAMAKEHDELFLVERPKIVAGIATAAAEGDRSENAEYIYGKKKLRELDKRIQYLGGLLKDIKVVDLELIKSDSVVFGATVQVVDEDGKEKEYTIVGEGESDYIPGSISDRTPIAKALLGKKVGQTVTAWRPAGEIELEIVGLKFAGKSWDE